MIHSSSDEKFGSKREEVTGGSKILCNEGLHNLYASPNIVRVVKLRRVRWVGQRDEKLIQNFDLKA
jgi:hypothetical protein